MKKALLIGSLVLLGFSSGSSVLATSGACSSHRGVDCASGPDRDGSVICMDGTRTSRVLYTSMVKCQGIVLPTSVKVIQPPTAFVGIPRTKEDLGRCTVVSDINKKTYALKGNTAFKLMTVTSKKCVGHAEVQPSERSSF